MNLTDIKPHELVKYLPNPRPFITEQVSRITDCVNSIKTLQESIKAEEGHLGFLQGVFEDAVVTDYTDEQIEFAKRMVFEEAVASQRTAAAPAPAPAPARLPAAAKRVFNAVTAAMQGAEEIGGPEGEEYIALMQAIIREAEERIANCRELND